MQKPKRTTPKMMHRAAELRTPALAGCAREEQTPAEAKLWAYLRTRRTNGIDFRRQCVIRSKATTDSGASRPPNPEHVVHRFRSMPSTYCG